MWQNHLLQATVVKMKIKILILNNLNQPVEHQQPEQTVETAESTGALVVSTFKPLNNSNM